MTHRKNCLAALLVSLAALSLLLAGAIRPAEATPPRQDGAQNATPAFVAPPTNTPRPTYTPQPTAVASPTPRFDVPREVVDHYVFGRPFPRDPNNVVKDFPARTYPYGSTNYGGLATHHGIDIQNPQGTPVLAVGSGTVYYAGPDDELQFGPMLNFYGNLVVIEHDVVLADGRAIYTLYGHLSKVGVETGQRVAESDRIGWVGSTGVALGAHLHLEVRVGDPTDYGSTVNPELWIRPWPNFGTIAGRIVDENGERVYEATINFQMKDRSGPVRTAFSYADDSVNPDPIFGEHYVHGDLPDGEYDVYVKVGSSIRWRGTATVEPGKTTWLDIQFK